MPLYIGVDGNIKSPVRFFAGIDGEKREIKEFWVNDNGILKRIFYKESETKLIASAFDAGNFTQQLKAYYVYEIYAISRGGNGGNGGSNWGLYHGGGGGAGGNGAVFYIKFKPLTALSLSMNITPQNIIIQMSSSKESVFEQHLSSGENGNNGENAGAFKPNPSGGVSGNGGVVLEKINKLLDYAEIIDTYQYNGTKAGQAGNNDGMPAPEPTRTKMTNPPYIAKAGQDGYYSTDSENFCFGNAAGGGNSDTNGGKGAMGAILLYESK